MTLPTLKNAYTSSQITELETLIDNKVASFLSSGVYLVKVNGNLVRYDTISDTPIQDAINDAQQNVSSYDSVLLVNYETSPSYKMEQNIILRNGVNLYAIGNTKVYSNSADNVPLFTDNGQFVQVFFVGYWNMVRYGGAGANNRCAVKTTNVASQIYFPDFVVADTSSGSNISFDCYSLDIGMGFWTGSVKINGGKSIINSDPSYTGGLIVTGGELDYYGRLTSITQSGGTVNTYGTVNTITLSGNGLLRHRNNVQQINQSGGILFLYNSNSYSGYYVTGGTGYLYNSILNGMTVIGSSSVNVFSCSIGQNQNELESQVEIGGVGAKVILDSCRIVGTDVYGTLGVGLLCTNGTAVVSNCTIVMTDYDGGGVRSLKQTGSGVIKNYNSISNAAKDGTIGVMALTVNAAVE